VTAPTKIAQLRAADRLQRAIDVIAAQGLRHHCADEEVSYLWISEHPAERQLAIKLCRGCPILTVCDQTASARRESWGVWGGKDRSRSPGKVGRPRKTAIEV
jgi:hypothetical protein